METIGSIRRLTLKRIVLGLWLGYKGEGDQDKIAGNHIPGILVEWKEGKITLGELAEWA